MSKNLRLILGERAKAHRVGAKIAHANLAEAWTNRRSLDDLHDAIRFEREEAEHIGAAVELESILREMCPDCGALLHCA